MKVDLKNVADVISVSAPSQDEENTSSPTVSDFTGHQALLEDFIRAIQEDLAPVCDGNEGRRSIALVEAIYRAARENRRA